MSSVAHLVIALAFSLSIFFFTKNSTRRFNYPLIFIFVIGSILPDLLTILDLIPILVGEIPYYNPLRYYYHSMSGCVVVSLFFAGFFKNLNKEAKISSKISFIQIYLLLLAAGFMHFGIDMLTEPVRIIDNIYVSIYDFYTPYGVFGEQDLAVVIFIINTFVIPLIFCYLALVRVEIKSKFLIVCDNLIENEEWDTLNDFVNFWCNTSEIVRLELQNSGNISKLLSEVIEEG